MVCFDLCSGRNVLSFNVGIFLLVCWIVESASWTDYKRMSYRIRNPLIRTVLNRVYTDEAEKHKDHSSWYKVNVDHFPETMSDKFIRSVEDDETKAFLKNCYEKGDAVFTQVYQTVAKSFLTWFMSSTSANGMLRRGSMFIFSKSQLRKLLSHPEGWTGNTLLDLGAGDGRVTEQMAPLFRKVYVTEMSTTMCWRLAELEYNVLQVDEWYTDNRQYDLISCLNLLDRCDKPMTLLRQIRKSLTPNTGRALLAVVIPFSPYVEYGSDHKPSEYVHISGTSFEEQTRELAACLLEPAGFTVERLTRLPYLCEGDLQRSFYVLDDALFVLRAI